MSDIQIDRNVPLPDGPAQGRSCKYPIAKMEIGDSFFLPESSHRAVSGIHTYYRRKLGYKLVTRTRTEDGIKGVRVWRAQ